MLLIDRKLARLKNDDECAIFPKLTELVKKSSNLTRIGEKKPYHPISYSLTYFIELVRRLCFYFAESLTGLTNGLAMRGAELKRAKVASVFYDWFLWKVEIISEGAWLQRIFSRCFLPLHSFSKKPVSIGLINALLLLWCRRHYPWLLLLHIPYCR